MAAETDIAVQLLGRKWHVQLDETDVSHAVVYVTLPTGAPATAVIGITIPVGLSNPGLDPAHHRLMDYVDAEKRDSSIVIKYGDAIMFTGREAQVSNVRITADETSFKMTIQAKPAVPAVGADTSKGSG